jgi:hypothetical protein
MTSRPLNHGSTQSAACILAQVIVVYNTQRRRKYMRFFSKKAVYMQLVIIVCGLMVLWTSSMYSRSCIHPIL